jgi:hypothetical protein
MTTSVSSAGSQGNEEVVPGAIVVVYPSYRVCSAVSAKYRVDVIDVV